MAQDDEAESNERYRQQAERILRELFRHATVDGRWGAFGIVMSVENGIIKTLRTISKETTRL